jgi:hypothetical protein
MARRVVFEPALGRVLEARFPFYPMDSISAAVRRELGARHRMASETPPPYARDTFTVQWVVRTSSGSFRVTPVYYIDSADDAFIVVDVSVFPEPEE